MRIHSDWSGFKTGRRTFTFPFLHCTLFHCYNRFCQSESEGFSKIAINAVIIIASNNVRKFLKINWFDEMFCDWTLYTLHFNVIFFVLTSAAVAL